MPQLQAYGSFINFKSNHLIDSTSDSVTAMKGAGAIWGVMSCPRSLGFELPIMLLVDPLYLLLLVI